MAQAKGDGRGPRVGVSDALVRYGTKGLKTLGGRVQEEYLASLKDWRKAHKFWMEMADDVTVATLLDALKLPLLAAEFDVEPAGETEADRAAADFLWENMQGLEAQTWRSHVRDMLEAIEFGFALAEIVLSKRRDGRLWLRNLDPRGQETLERWEFAEDDRATAFIQLDPDTGRLATIPLEKCVHVTFRGRKGSPMGKPLCRDIFRPWRFLKDLENLEAIGIERDVGGMPVFTLPEEPLTADDETGVRNMLRDLRVDEASYAMIPHGAALNPYGGGGKAYNVAEVIARKQKEILMRGYAQFLMLGMERVGTQALVKGSQDFFMLGLTAHQQMLLEAWNSQLVSYLFRFNEFAGTSGLPRINWDQPGRVDVSGFLDAYAKGVEAGVVTPTPEDEGDVRAKLDLPDLPEGVGERAEGIEEPPEFPGSFEWAGEDMAVRH